MGIVEETPHLSPRLPVYNTMEFDIPSIERRLSLHVMPSNTNNLLKCIYTLANCNFS